MSADPFFDSNVLLYLVSGDQARANRAEALLAGGGTISVQVLNEMSSVALRKFGMDWQQVETLLEPVRRQCSIEPLTEATYDLGCWLAGRHGFSVYDAMIVASALLAGAGMLYSEDMHHGLEVEGRLQICNPFRSRFVQEGGTMVEGGC